MQFTTLAFLAAVASTVTAQSTVSISDLPSCALSPAVSAIETTGCGADIACVCKNSAFLTGLTPQIQAACSASDFAKAVSVAYQLCLENGVTITTAAIASSTTALASTTSSAPASLAATTTITTTSAPVSTSATLTTSSNGTVSISAVPSVVTANVAAVHGTWAAAGLLGVGALLAAL